MAAANPVTSSQPETQTPSSRPMSSVDIGLMVGAIVLFFVIITSVFVVRGIDERRRAKRLLQTVEDGNAESQYEHQANQGTNVTEPEQIGSTSMRHTRLWERRARARLLRALRFPVHPSAETRTIHVHPPALYRLSVGTVATGAEAQAQATVDPEAQAAAAAEVIVVERLSKNINEQHLYEIFGQFGRVKDLDLPMNRTFGTNRGTAYILYNYEDDAEAAIAHMHEAQVDGSAINVSIVLPRRKLSPAPPTARRGANIDPRVPFSGGRGGPPGAGVGANNGMSGGGGRRRKSPGSRYGPRSDVYRPGSRSPSRSSVGPPSRTGGGRYRSRSNNSYSSRSRSRSPGPRRKPAGRHGENDARRRGSIDSYGERSRSRSRGRGPR
ncbi:uncharacterized protein FIESC28_00700 [Fusarium coffeatum]|uniref:RRM domain-containing protein n=1 Tax=Fusarium coffeatum TaxID=231269 RepID=A0A366SB06_9HYPO|nr:uncharacterized protein FIESC28_00700 [Fusarium coffeatum]RBR26514.1 hypothetical protein FIESC28_00700 [Fusarium coffeatum]